MIDYLKGVEKNNDTYAQVFLAAERGLWTVSAIAGATQADHGSDVGKHFAKKAGKVKRL